MVAIGILSEQFFLVFGKFIDEFIDEFVDEEKDEYKELVTRCAETQKLLRDEYDGELRYNFSSLRMPTFFWALYPIYR